MHGIVIYVVTEKYIKGIQNGKDELSKDHPTRRSARRKPAIMSIVSRMLAADGLSLSFGLEGTSRYRGDGSDGEREREDARLRFVDGGDR